MNLKYVLLETRRAYRNKRFLFFTIGMPIVLYLLYVQLYGQSEDVGGVSTNAYLMATMAGFGAMSAALSAGTRIAMERQAGWNRQLRLTPLPGWGYLMSKAIVAMLVAIPSIVLVYAAGAVLEDVRLTPAQWVMSAVAIWVAILPFATLGLVIGYVSNPESSSAIQSAVFMLMGLFGGIFVPAELLPGVLGNFAQVLPSYWLGTVARGPFTDGGFDWVAIPVLLAWTLATGMLVIRRYQVDTARA